MYIQYNTIQWLRMRIIPNTVLLLLVLLGAIRKLRKHIFDQVKGQLISKCLFGAIDSNKKPTNLF